VLETLLGAACLRAANRNVSLSSLQIPAVAAVTCFGALIYIVIRARQGRAEFTLIDAAIAAIVVAILAGAAIPLFEAVSGGAQTTVLATNLRTLRSQIALYKAEHGGVPPVLYEGGLPQLIQPTNADGVPGPRGKKYPYGPYLAAGMPLNPVTGRSVVTPTPDYPPARASGNGGWLYHQASGQISPDLEEFLRE
jgi:general secretion pathway protein G